MSFRRRQQRRAASLQPAAHLRGWSSGAARLGCLSVPPAVASERTLVHQAERDPLLS